jgi:chromosome partitioning protein
MAPRVIALAASKGGCMKSSLASALAVQAVKEGGKVAMLDWEPQGSLTLWWVMRGKPDNPHLVREAGDPLDVVATLASSEFSWVFLDTPPSGMDEISNAIEAAHFVLVPVQASVFDLAAIRPVVAACGELHRPFAFVLTREHPRRVALNDSAVIHLKKMGPVLAEHVQERTAYVSALGLGKTGPEHPDSKQAREARSEIEALWTAVKTLVTGSATKPLKVRAR